MLHIGTGNKRLKIDVDTKRSGTNLFFMFGVYKLILINACKHFHNKKIYTGMETHCNEEHLHPSFNPRKL